MSASIAGRWPTPRSSGPASARKSPARSPGCRSRPFDPAPGLRAPRRVWGTSASFSRPRPPPRSWRTSPPCVKQFLQAGAEIVEIAFPPSFAFVGPCWSIIKQAELYAYHRHLFEAYRDDYPPKLKVRLEKGCIDLRPPVCRTPALPDPFPAGDVRADGRCGCGDHARSPRRRRPGGSPPPDRASSTSPGASPDSRQCRFRRVSTPTDSPLRCRWRRSPTAKRRLLDVAAWCEKILAFTATPTPQGSRLPERISRRKSPAGPFGIDESLIPDMTAYLVI